MAEYEKLRGEIEALQQHEAQTHDAVKSSQHHE
jgi:hypothetical protein